MSGARATKDLHVLPRVEDSWSFLYVERCVVDQEDRAIAMHDAHGSVSVPCASLTALMLGPGTNITHAAIRALAENGCLVTWVGEGVVRFYAEGMGETRSARHLLHQARLCTDPTKRLEVVRRMYQFRFDEPLDKALTLQQIRGREGIRVREAYARASRATGVPWQGRNYQRGRWDGADSINRALSVANSCLYGVCHAAIVSAGYSPALGFIHTGKMLSFVYDVADLYKADVTIPLAFRMVAENTLDLEGRVRRACRDAFHAMRLLQRIVTDIDRVLLGRALDRRGDAGAVAMDEDEALPGELWDPEEGPVPGGVDHASDVELVEGPNDGPDTSEGRAAIAVSMANAYDGTTDFEPLVAGASTALGTEEALGSHTTKQQGNERPERRQRRPGSVPGGEWSR